MELRKNMHDYNRLILECRNHVINGKKISKNEKYSFLLESVEGGDQRGRYSLLGCKPDIIWKVKNEKVSTVS